MGTGCRRDWRERPHWPRGSGRSCRRRGGKQAFQAGAPGFAGRMFGRIKQASPAYRDYPQSGGADARFGAIHAPVNFASRSEPGARVAFNTCAEPQGFRWFLHGPSCENQPACDRRRLAPPKLPGRAAARNTGGDGGGLLRRRGPFRHWPVVMVRYGMATTRRAFWQTLSKVPSVSGMRGLMTSTWAQSGR